MEQIGRGYLVDVRMQELPAIGGRGHSESGLERLDIPDAGSATVAGHLIYVNLQHLGQTEEGWVHWLFRQLLQGLGVPCVHLVESDPESRAPGRIFHGRKNQYLSVGGDVELGVGVRADQLQKLPLKTALHVLPLDIVQQSAIDSK